MTNNDHPNADTMLPEGISIRGATADDTGSVLPLVNALGEGDEAKRSEIFRELLGNPLYNAYVAVDGDEVVGFVDLWELPDLVHEGRIGYVMTVVVGPGWWGKGIGGALLQQVLEVAAGKGLSEMHVSTEKDNVRAKKLYARMGFKAESLLLEWSREDGAGDKRE